MSKKVAVCFFCKTPEPRADARAKAVLCSRCVARLAGSPESIGKVPKTVAPKMPKAKRESKKVVTKTKVVAKKASSTTSSVDNNKKFGGPPGRGWHLAKKFIAPNGSVWSFGEMIKPPTKVED